MNAVERTKAKLRTCAASWRGCKLASEENMVLDFAGLQGLYVGQATSHTSDDEGKSYVVPKVRRMLPLIVR